MSAGKITLVVGGGRPACSPVLRCLQHPPLAVPYLEKEGISRRCGPSSRERQRARHGDELTWVTHSDERILVVQLPPLQLLRRVWCGCSQ